MQRVSIPLRMASLVLVAAIAACPGAASEDGGDGSHVIRDGAGGTDTAAGRDTVVRPDVSFDRAIVADAAVPDVRPDAPVADGNRHDAAVTDAAVGDGAVRDSVAVDGRGPDGAAADATGSRCPSQVTIAFSGTVATVSGNPLGLNESVRTTAVTGHLTYDLCVGDLEAALDRGEYDHAGEESGAFAVAVGGLDVRGSTRPVVQVEDLDPDTFRFLDGPQFLDPTARPMTVGGTADSDLELWIAITDSSGAAFSSDALPALFPFLDIASFPHTFSLSDGDGTLLIQLSAMTR